MYKTAFEMLLKSQLLPKHIQLGSNGEVPEPPRCSSTRWFIFAFEKCFVLCFILLNNVYV